MNILKTAFFMLCFMISINVFAQVGQGSLDLSNELNELTSTENISSENLPLVDFDFTSDISVLKDDIKIIADINKTKKIESIKAECAASFAPEPVSLFTISKPRPISPNNRAIEDCHERYIKPQGNVKVSREIIDKNLECQVRLTKLYKEQDYQNTADAIDRADAAKARKKQKRAQTQNYCKSIQEDLDANRLPKGNFPQWNEIDEVKAVQASSSLQSEIDKVLAEGDALNAKLFHDKRIEEAAKQAKRDAQITERDNTRKEWCRTRISAGACPCNCEDMCTRPPPEPGFPQVCEK